MAGAGLGIGWATKHCRTQYRQLEEAKRKKDQEETCKRTKEQHGDNCNACKGVEPPKELSHQQVPPPLARFLNRALLTRPSVLAKG